MFLPGFSTLGSTGPIEKLKGGHEGEERVTVYEYILQDDGASERIISHMNIRRSRHFMDVADWVFRKVAITNRPFYQYGGHIELIRSKGYYRMPREHEHISFVFSSAFRDTFSSFLFFFSLLHSNTVQGSFFPITILL